MLQTTGLTGLKSYVKNLVAANSLLNRHRLVALLGNSNATNTGVKQHSAMACLVFCKNKWALLWDLPF